MPTKTKNALTGSNAGRNVKEVDGQWFSFMGFFAMANVVLIIDS